MVVVTVVDLIVNGDTLKVHQRSLFFFLFA